MKNQRPRKLGFILMGIGLVLMGWGIYQASRPDQFSAQARIRVPTPAIDSEWQWSCDPYLDWTEADVIQSETILVNVVSRLDLISRWSGEAGGTQKLKVPEAIAMVRRRLEVRQLANTNIYEICLGSKDPAEAATIANEIATTYCEWRCERSRRVAEAVLAEVEKLLAQHDQKILQISNRAIQLEREFGISESEIEQLAARDSAPNEQTPTIGRPFYDAKRDFFELKDFRRLLTRRLSSVQAELAFPETPPAEVLERAAPPTAPVRSCVALGAAFGISGLLCSAFGAALGFSDQRC